jgi:hypothetical protein
MRTADPEFSFIVRAVRVMFAHFDRLSLLSVLSGMSATSLRHDHPRRPGSGIDRFAELCPNVLGCVE